MPLKIESSPQNVTIRALGSEGTIIKPDLIACNGIIHVIDSVLLPFDAGVLDDEQKDELRDAIRALFELNGPGTIADDVIRKNVAAILLGTTRSRIWTSRLVSPRRLRLPSTKRGNRRADKREEQRGALAADDSTKGAKRVSRKNSRLCLLSRGRTGEQIRKRDPHYLHTTIMQIFRLILYNFFLSPLN